MEEHSAIDNVQINKTSQQLEIGAYSYIRSGVINHAARIGRFCSIGQNVLLGQDPRNHPVNWASTSNQLCTNYQSQPEHTDIGHDVWIGEGAIIMAGVKIGNGAIIGANAIVTKDVPPYQIVAGNPAKQIKLRFDEHTIQLLQASRWWEKPFKLLHQLDHKNIPSFIASVNKIEEQANYKSLSILRKKYFTVVTQLNTSISN